MLFRKHFSVSKTGLIISMVHSSVISYIDIKFELKFTRNVVFMFLLYFLYIYIYSQSVAYRQRTCARWCVFRCTDTHLFLNKIALPRVHETLLEKIINICKCYVWCLKNISKYPKSWKISKFSNTIKRIPQQCINNL